MLILLVSWLAKTPPNNTRNISGNTIEKKTAWRSRRKPLRIATDKDRQRPHARYSLPVTVKKDVLERCALDLQTFERVPFGQRGQHGRWIVRLQHDLSVVDARRSRLPGWRTLRSRSASIRRR